MVLSKEEQEAIDRLCVIADVAAVRLIADGRKRLGKELMSASTDIKGYETYGEVYTPCGKQD